MERRYDPPQWVKLKTAIIDLIEETTYEDIGAGFYYGLKYAELGEEPKQLPLSRDAKRIYRVICKAVDKAIEDTEAKRLKGREAQAKKKARAATGEADTQDFEKPDIPP